MAKTKVAASIQYAADSSQLAITRPANDGPKIWPSWMPVWLSAAAAGI